MLLAGRVSTGARLVRRLSASAHLALSGLWTRPHTGQLEDGQVRTGLSALPHPPGLGPLDLLPYGVSCVIKLHPSLRHPEGLSLPSQPSSEAFSDLPRCVLNSPLIRTLLPESGA